MYKGILHTHYLVVVLFLLIYVIKTVLLLSNKTDLLQVFTKKVKVPEMIVSFLFLATGIYLATQLPFGGKYDHLFWIKIVMVVASIPIAVIGFKKQNKILAALSLLLITGSFGLAEVYHKKKGIAKDSQVADVSSAKGLYEKNCKLCHGDDGKLGMAGAKDLSATALDVAGIKEVILKGKNTMAPVAVSDEQAELIAGYVTSDLKGH
ncbi:MAG: cytochrome c, mono- and diheme variant family [Bacteroidetes bacterium]|jgi:mono/diheme cytochrome c family protein|nr:cytochrome c, mono- and diheme variant family [Bacteroidota bacterium]